MKNHESSDTRVKRSREERAIKVALTERDAAAILDIYEEKSNEKQFFTVKFRIETLTREQQQQVTTTSEVRIRRMLYAVVLCCDYVTPINTNIQWYTPPRALSPRFTSL